MRRVVRSEKKRDYCVSLSREQKHSSTQNVFDDCRQPSSASGIYNHYLTQYSDTMPREWLRLCTRLVHHQFALITKKRLIFEQTSVSYNNSQKLGIPQFSVISQLKIIILVIVGLTQVPKSETTKIVMTIWILTREQRK